MARQTRRSRRQDTRWAGSAATVALIGISIAQFVVSGHVDGVLVGALLAIVLAAGGQNLERAVLRNLGDRLYEASGDDPKKR